MLSRTTVYALALAPELGIGDRDIFYCGAVPRYCYIWYRTQTIALQKVTHPRTLYHIWYRTKR